MRFVFLWRFSTSTFVKFIHSWFERASQPRFLRHTLLYPTCPPFFGIFGTFLLLFHPFLKHFMRSPTSSFDIQCTTLTSPTPSYWRYLFQQPTTTIECLVRRVGILGTLYWYKYKLRQEVNLQDSLA